MLLAYNTVTTNHSAKSQYTIMHLLFVNVGVKFHPNGFDAHHVEALCLQYTLARLSLTLPKSRLSRLSTIPCQVSVMKMDSLSSLNLALKYI